MLYILAALAVIPWIMSSIRKLMHLPITMLESLVYGAASIGFFVCMIINWSDHTFSLTVLSLAAFALFICVSMTLSTNSKNSHQVKNHGLYVKK